MMTDTKPATSAKYTLSESALIIGGTGIAVGIVAPIVIALITFPVILLNAWIRMTVWDWFGPLYFHLPIAPYWAWVMAGLFLELFPGASQPAIKDEYLKPVKTWQVIVARQALQFVVLGMAWLVHLWWLR